MQIFAVSVDRKFAVEIQKFFRGEKMNSFRIFSSSFSSNRIQFGCNNVRSLKMEWRNGRNERQFFTISRRDAGHSHFANIKHKKDKNDKKRMSIFTKISKQLMTAVKCNCDFPHYLQFSSHLLHFSDFLIE